MLPMSSCKNGGCCGWVQRLKLYPRERIERPPVSRRSPSSSSGWAYLYPPTSSICIYRLECVCRAWGWCGTMYPISLCGLRLKRPARYFPLTCCFAMCVRSSTYLLFSFSFLLLRLSDETLFLSFFVGTIQTSVQAHV